MFSPHCTFRQGSACRYNFLRGTACANTCACKSVCVSSCHVTRLTAESHVRYTAGDTIWPERFNKINIHERASLLFAHTCIHTTVLSSQ